MAKLKRRSPRTTLAFDALTVEGSLIAPAQIARVAALQATNQAEADYGIPKGLSLRDEIARQFRIGQALHAELFASDTPSLAATVKFAEAFLRDVLGFADVTRVGHRDIGGELRPLTLEGRGGRTPVMVGPPGDDLDRASSQLSQDRRRSAASALQDWLNASDDALWGLVTNGHRLRLMRDNASLTRPAYIEADLDAIFADEAFADFAALFLLAHATRFGPAGAAVTDCPLERWREAGAAEGISARERLRDGVEAALLALGNGFLAANPPLRQRLLDGALPLSAFFGQTLRLVYRLIFLLAAEDRGLLHLPTASAAARRLYAEGYSVGRLRDAAVRRAAWDHHHDRWEGLLVTFAALAAGEKALGLPALDGLFAHASLPDLDGTRLENRALMEAVYRLAWLKEDGGLVPVNWRDMETEELGSVYESLLELTPRLEEHGRRFAFAEGAETKGNARKTSGSYYTPDSLVQALLDSALDPVLDRVESEADDPAKALLTVTVIDPACGSGHFLLAAARRIATRLARHRAQGVPSAEDFRHALRDVVRASIHGTDLNPMAVELTKVALWIESVDPGKPLGFLDANIRCGNSLLGVFDMAVLEKGIPDAAYKPLAGDDKAVAKFFEKKNKAEKAGQGSLDFHGGGGRLPVAAPLVKELTAIRAMPEESPADIEAKRARLDRARAGAWAQRQAADLYTAAFLLPKTGDVPDNPRTATIPTSAAVFDALAGRTLYGPLIGRAQDAAAAAGAFHWPLEFPDVMAAGGFDVVLGNPPWERIKLQEQEFFAPRDPEIAAAPNAAARRRLIEKLRAAPAGSPERRLYDEFETAQRTAEAASVFARVPGEEGGRFPLAGRGDVNTYALFAEHFARLISPRGQSGMIVPTGIATDATTAPFFGWLVSEKRLAELIDFENRHAIFPSVHRSYKFSLLTIGRKVPVARFAFFLTNTAQMAEKERRFTLTAEDIARINPNTKTAPVFRANRDAELTAKIYSRVPVLIDEEKGAAGNPWGIRLRRMFDKTLASAAGDLKAVEEVQDSDDWLAVHEGEYGHQFDHRAATYVSGVIVPNKNRDVDFEPSYALRARRSAYLRFLDNWGVNYLTSAFIAFRRVARSTDERTCIATLLPNMPLTYGWITIIDPIPQHKSLLLANLNALVFDYCLRSSLSQPSIPQNTFEQLATLAPSSYRSIETQFILARVLELTYTSHSMAPFARDLGYDGPPFAWDEDRRAWLRAELDAWYARAYGLSRDELRYILDPADVMGPDYPSETFRVLKSNEIRKYGEYRTARLVLQAWDRQEAEGDQAA